MKKKTARQLDREIDEALNQGRHFALVNRPWWLWQQAALAEAKRLSQEVLFGESA